MVNEQVHAFIQVFVVSLQVSGTLELWLHKSAALSKAIDEETGLKLFNLPYKLS